MLNIKKILLFAFVTLIFGCSHEKSNLDLLSEVFEIKKNEVLMNKLKSDNDSISFSWSYGYNLSGKYSSLNSKIYNNKEFTAKESKEKLKQESEHLQSLLKEEFKNYSAFNRMHLFLISNEKTIDSLKIKL